MPKSSSEIIEYVRRHLENKKKNTTECTYALSEQVSYPQLFRLSALGISTQQLLLNEWQARCLSPHIGNPVGYLFVMIRKAQLGTFRATKFGK